MIARLLSWWSQRSRGFAPLTHITRTVSVLTVWMESDFRSPWPACIFFFNIFSPGDALQKRFLVKAKLKGKESELNGRELVIKYVLKDGNRSSVFSCWFCPHLTVMTSSLTADEDDDADDAGLFIFFIYLFAFLSCPLVFCPLENCSAHIKLSTRRTGAEECV